MNKEEVIEMVMQIGGCDRPEDDSPALKMFVTFAKLVAEHEREAFIAHAMTSAEKAIDVAIKLEREACAKLCDLAMLQNQEAINELEEDEHVAKCFIQGAMTQLVKTSKAIRARGQE